MTKKQIKKELNEIYDYISSDFCTDFHLEEAKKAEKKLLNLLVEKERKEV